MQGFKLSRFGGIRPRSPESLLGEGEATTAENCDFAYGELRNTKAGLFLKNVSNAPSSIYTDDGLTFFTWPTNVSAVRAPMVADQFNRLYYTDGSEIRVADRLRTTLSGGVPASSYRVGVPRPTKAPSLVVAATVDLANVNLSGMFHYEMAGVKYQERAFTPAWDGSRWTYTIPDILTGAAVEPYTYRISKYSKTITNPAWVTNPTYNQQYITTEYTLPANTYVKVLSTSTVQIKEPSRTYTETGITAFKDEDGLIHEVESIFTMQKYGFVKDQTVQISTRTPIGSSPVFRLTAKDKTTGETVFDIYSSASTLCDASAFWRLNASVSESNPSLYLLSLDQGVQEKDKVTRAVVYCYVNTYGEQGPPSDPATVTTGQDIAVNVKVTLDATGNYAPINEIRIYRTPDGSSIADYFYAGSFPVFGKSPGVYTIIDNVKSAQLNENLSSDYFYPPPAGLGGIMALPNGILCAFKDNELWFSEAYKPWAWPPSYVKTLDARIVGSISHGSGAVITTVKAPYLVSGVSPDSMSVSRLNVDQSGVSDGSIAVVDGMVVYASHDGIVTINGASASLAQGQKFFTREVWRSRYSNGLATMKFAVWDGRLVVYSSAGSFTPFMIRFDEAAGQMTELPSFRAKCHFVSQLSDQCYYADAATLYQFNGGGDQIATWQSGEIVLVAPTNFGACHAIAEGNWTVELWAYDGRQYAMKHSQPISSGATTFRLPSGYLSDRYRLRISGNGRFRELRVAETGKGLSYL